MRLSAQLAAVLLASLIFHASRPSLAQTTSYPLSFTAGWNLAGNVLATPISVKTIFGTQTNIQTVWKWDAAGSKWAFYAPALDAAGTLAPYAATNGYSVLTTISPGEGFWVNALAPVSLGTQSGTGFSLAASNLVGGWNLVATATDMTPSTLSSTLGNVTSLWAWDNANSAWYFYAPSLAANNTLASYLQNKGYKDFGTLTLGKGMGFWINYAGVLGSFNGNIILGAPTDTSIKANVFSQDQSGTVYIAYGTSSGTYAKQSSTQTLTAGTPLELTLNGLSANTQYYYRLYYQAADGTGSGPTNEYSFHTARPPGSTFTFTVQADSHLDENSILAQYLRTLTNVRTDAPDFHVDLGDTFMCEKHSEPFTATLQMAPDLPTVIARYKYERTNFGIVSHSAPLYLVNGNHEGESGWLADGTAQNIAIWTALARLKYYVNPVPDGFYSGDSSEEPFVGKRASWYAWQWGDALFVVLDPFWNSKTQASKNAWALTLGDRQYQWLEQTLAASKATFKFVFIHNLVGGLDGQMRGGIEAAPFFEWGGKNLDGFSGFAQNRIGWPTPIHQMLVRYGVTAVFHGHDHLYAKQELDGIVYQEVPQPSARNFSSGATLAAQYHYASGTILSSSGHLRVTVSPTGVTTQYVRAWLPANETAQQANGQVADVWSLPAP